MKTLTQQLLDDNTDGQLIEIIAALSAAGQQLAQWVNRGAVTGILGAAASENIQGETQQQLDILANDCLKDALLALPQVAAIASEEEPTPVRGHSAGRYVVAYDPLDGSSNIAINGLIGTIFTVYRTRGDIAFAAPEQFLQSGREQCCAGYILYGPAMMLALTTGGPSRMYAFDSHQREFVLTQQQLRITAQTQEYAVNMAHFHSWAPAIQRYIGDLQLGANGPRAKAYNMRWSGAMVADIHRILVRGGIFLYPSQGQRPEPNKLRLVYEANPMAMLVAQAGGQASDGQCSILDIRPTALHQRVPVIMGASAEVQRVMALITAHGA